MAIQKQGILGTPKGKIGSVMGYRRNGKGIIQAVPTVVNKEARLANFYSNAIRQRIAFLWPYIPSVLRARWDPITPAGMTGEEYYNQFNRELALQIKPSNTTNLWMAPTVNMPTYDYELSMNYESKILTINVGGDGTNQFGNTLNQFRINNLKDDSSTITVATQSWINNQFSYDIDLSSDFIPGLLGFFIFARWNGNVTQSQYSYIDIVQRRT